MKSTRTEATVDVQIAPEMLRLRQEVVGVDQEVPVLDGGTRPYVNLDNAASTPALQSVQEKVNEFLKWYSSVHRGAGFKSLVSTHAYEEAHRLVAEFVGADPETHCVLFGKNTTEAINVLAASLELQEEDVVITTAAEHHSNDLPWRPVAEVEYVMPDDDGDIPLEGVEELLCRHEGRVKLVATTGASNVTGLLPPVHRMAELAHAHGARILVDCAQLAPHREIAMGELGTPGHLDFVAISGHKMYAPFGTGALIGPEAVFGQGGPAHRGGGTIDIVTLNEVYLAAPPERYEAGSPNVVGAVALGASILKLRSVGMERIAAHEKYLTSYALQRMEDLDGLTLYGPTGAGRVDDRLGVLPFSIEGVPHGKVAAILSAEGAIGVRSGCFCAHPYVLHLLGIGGSDYESYKQDVLGGDRSRLPGLVRVSFGCYNTVEEIDWLMEMLQRVIDGDYQGRYQVDRASGEYFPAGFDSSIVEACFTF